MRELAIAAGAVLAAAAFPAASDQPASGLQTPPGPGMGPGMTMPSADPAMNDYMNAMRSMNHAMMAAWDQDPDRTFALKMIEHHRGGMAMADVLMRRGDSPELKRMAEKTKREQLKEIDELQKWLDRNGGRTPKH